MNEVFVVTTGWRDSGLTIKTVTYKEDLANRIADTLNLDLSQHAVVHRIEVTTDDSMLMTRFRVTCKIHYYGYEYHIEDLKISPDIEIIGNTKFEMEDDIHNVWVDIIVVWVYGEDPDTFKKYCENRVKERFIEWVETRKKAFNPKG